MSTSAGSYRYGCPRDNARVRTLTLVLAGFLISLSLGGSSADGVGPQFLASTFRPEIAGSVGAVGQVHIVLALDPGDTSNLSWAIYSVEARVLSGPVILPRADHFALVLDSGEDLIIGTRHASVIPGVLEFCSELNYTRVVGGVPAGTWNHSVGGCVFRALLFPSGDVAIVSITDPDTSPGRLSFMSLSREGVKRTSRELANGTIFGFGASMNSVGEVEVVFSGLAESSGTRTVIKYGRLQADGGWSLPPVDLLELGHQNVTDLEVAVSATTRAVFWTEREGSTFTSRVLLMEQNGTSVGLPIVVLGGPQPLDHPVLLAVEGKAFVVGTVSGGLVAYALEDPMGPVDRLKLPSVTNVYDVHGQADSGGLSLIYVTEHEGAYGTWFLHAAAGEPQVPYWPLAVVAGCVVAVFCGWLVLRRRRRRIGGNDTGGPSDRTETMSLREDST